VSQGSMVGASALENKDAALSDERALAELWEWAPIEANQEARRRDWGGNFTLEEKEIGIHNVVTGLRRQLAEEEEEDEEGDEDEEMGVEALDRSDMEFVEPAHRKPGGIETGLDAVTAAVPVKAPASTALPLDEILRYMVTGAMPTSGLS
jgi:mediator of RNA polymerase II transcription subunit 8, fungi type